MLFDKRLDVAVYIVLVDKFYMMRCRHLPTKNNRDGWRIGKEAANLILRVAKERHAGHNKDLLQMIIEGAKDSDFTREETDRFIVDNCKNIYLAGYETTSLTATWCLMLLAVNQDWQERVRAEVLQVCQGRIPDGDMLNKMKQVISFACCQSTVQHT